MTVVQILIPGYSFADSDNDSIPDNIDLCINDPEVYNGYLDTDGCPDVQLDSSFDDKDGDGIADQFDICPNECRNLQ